MAALSETGQAQRERQFVVIDSAVEVLTTVNLSCEQLLLLAFNGEYIK